MSMVTWVGHQVTGRKPAELALNRILSVVH